MSIWKLISCRCKEYSFREILYYADGVYLKLQLNQKIPKDVPLGIKVLRWEREPYHSSRNICIIKQKILIGIIFIELFLNYCYERALPLTSGLINRDTLAQTRVTDIRTDTQALSR